MEEYSPVVDGSVQAAGSTNILSLIGWHPPHDPPHSPYAIVPSSALRTLSNRCGTFGVPQASQSTSLRMRNPVPERSTWNLPFWHLEAAEKQSPARANRTGLPSVFANWKSSLWTRPVVGSTRILLNLAFNKKKPRKYGLHQFQISLSGFHEFSCWKF